MKGHVPFNKGRKWSEYMSKRSQRRCSRGWIDIDVFRNKGAVAEGNYTRTDRPVLVKTSNGKYAIAHRREFLDHSWTWSGSGTFDSSVTHWRQIELK
jgi:hypothetical protein